MAAETAYGSRRTADPLPVPPTWLWPTVPSVGAFQSGPGCALGGLPQAAADPLAALPTYGRPLTGDRGDGMLPGTRRAIGSRIGRPASDVDDAVAVAASAAARHPDAGPSGPAGRAPGRPPVTAARASGRRGQVTPATTVPGRSSRRGTIG